MRSTGQSLILITIFQTPLFCILAFSQNMDHVVPRIFHTVKHVTAPRPSHYFFGY